MEPADPVPDGFLAPFEVSRAAEDLYGQLLRTATDGDRIDHAAVAELARVGLVQAEDGHVVAVPVRLAVERWVIEQEARIRRARLAASHYASIQGTTSGGFLEVIRGIDQAREAMHQVETGAEREVLCFDRAPYFSQRKGTISPVQESAAQRGVKYRVVYQQAVLEDPLIMAAVRNSTGLEEARTYPDVPVRMIIADEERALLLLPYGSAPDADGSRTDEPTDADAVLVHPSTLLDALVRLFGSIWSLAVPISSLDDTSWADEHRQLLQLLATGLTDASIARELGVSERTVQRRINRLHQLLGASTRFLLGVQAAKRGWI
ncbi:helix-turn-helix domain-containing protein [Microlunatus sp. GCM10028923]|uniref:helix-turn-helix transcriptional regulator n=1 Tax=Microlunatus sp. GCM10028923 TaxID=3273400 RepID=UPI0036061E58